jgi:hypothetical protein
MVLLQNHPPLTAPAAVPADPGPILVPVSADVVELSETPFFGDFLGGVAVACVFVERENVSMTFVDGGQMYVGDGERERERERERDG